MPDNAFGNETQGAPATAPLGAAEPDQVVPLEQLAQVGEDTPAIFAERLGDLMEGFGERCDALGVGLALAIAVDPTTGRPTVFCRGQTYHLARLAKETLDSLRAQVLTELGG